MAEGISPLDFLLAAMRDEQREFSTRMDAAKAAAPYVHARLTAVEHSGEVATSYVAVLPAEVESIEEWEQRYAPKH